MLSLCITSIIRPVTLWSINLEDVTCESQVSSFPFALHPSLTLQESNVSVAFWNIIEAELDFVAGNVPLMGPSFAKMRRNKDGQSSGDPSSGMNGMNNDSVASTRHVFRPKGPASGAGFQRMPDDQRGRLCSMAVPVAKADVHSVEMTGLPTHGIEAQTDLEQNVARDESPPGEWEERERAAKAYCDVLRYPTLCIETSLVTVWDEKGEIARAVQGRDSLV